MAHPRDHVLPLSAQLASTMTTLANVSAKIRKNGGSATTYTSATTPAITQNGDITYGYELQIPAGTYADGDVVEITWLYSGTAIAYDVELIGPAAVDGASYTTALAGALSARSTRTGTAQAGSSSSITLDAGASGLNDFYVGQWLVIASGAGAGQCRLITAYDGSTKIATVHSNWKTSPSSSSIFYLLAAADIQGVALVDTATLVTTTTTLTNAPADSAGITTLLGRLTAARAGYLDVLNGLVAAIWAAVTDSSGITTLLGRLTSGRAAALDHLDVDVSTRLASSSYVAPDNADIASILTDVSTILARVDVAVSTRLAAADYVAPDNSELDAIAAELELVKAKTDLLGTGTVIFEGPVLDAETIELVAGDDYLVADGRQLTFQAETWPDLTDATAIDLELRRTTHRQTTATFTGTATAADTVEFELTAAETTELPAGTWAFAIKATLADDSIVTLASGVATILALP